MSLRVKRFVFVACLTSMFLVFSSGIQAQNIRFVKEGASMSNSGQGWNNPSGDLQAMIDALDALIKNSNGAITEGEVWVAGGVGVPPYVPNRPANNTLITSPGNRDNAFVLRPNVKVYGGFPVPTPANNYNSGLTLVDRDWAAYPTVLDGQNYYYHVVVAAGADNAVLDGFTVMNGNANGNGLLHIYVAGNPYPYPIEEHSGGGIINCSSNSLTLANLVIKENYAVGNSSYGGGGGIRQYYGGEGSTPSCTLINTLMYNNTTGYFGGAINVKEGDFDIYSATISGNNDGGNSNTYSSMQGIDFQSGGQLTIYNSILWGNTPVSSNLPVNYDIACSLIGGVVFPFGTNLDGNLDPMFVNVFYGDYRIAANSPCRDKGISSYLYVNYPNTEKDLAGNPRIFGSRIDMGAYEDQKIRPNSSGVFFVKQGVSRKQRTEQREKER